MARYRFTAKTRAGETKTGSVSAVNEQVAIGLLQQRGFIVTSVVAEEKRKKLTSTVYSRITPKDIVIFTRQFSIMLSAGVTITHSLRVLIEQTENVKLKEVIRDTLGEVESGSRLSDALSKHPKAFSGFFVSMIRSGEASGRLSEILDELADQVEKDYNITSAVTSALAYPAFILVMLIGIGLYLVAAVLPTLGDVYSEFQADIPLSTRAVLAVGVFLNTYWWVVIVALLVAFYAIFIYVRSEEGRVAWDSYKLRMPLFKELYRKIIAARFSRNLSTLIAGDIPIVDALKIVAEVVKNKEIERDMKKVSEDVRNGIPLSEALEKRSGSSITPITIQMVAVGEETGRLDKVLKKTADFYTEEIDRTVSTLSAFVEPVTVVLLGIGVAVLIAAVLLPIYNLVNVI